MIDVDYDLSQVSIDRNARTSLERYRDLLPVRDPDNLIHADAGDTPCLRARTLGAELGLENLFLKDETKNPTGTIKDRPAEVVMSVFKERGVFHFTSSATGNSSTAFAHATVRNPPFRHSIFVGERWLPRITVDAHPRIDVWVLEGDIETVEAIAESRKFERLHGIPAEGGFFNLGRREGLKLAYLESVDQTETSFDWYFQGVSTAMGAYGSLKGARQYLQMGRVDRLPKLGLAQETTCAPQVRAFLDGSSTIQPQHVFARPDGVADALLKGNPKDTYPYVYNAMKEVGGTFVAVTQEEIATARSMLHELEGIPACNASSTTIAAVRKLVAQGVVRRDERILVMITGSDRDPTSHIKEYRRLRRGEGGAWIEVTGERVSQSVGSSVT
jgi:threonine synthase